MDKGIFVKDIAANEKIEGLFVVGSAQQAQSRNGPYWKLVLMDASGSLPANIWQPLSARFESIEAGLFALVAGRSSLYKNELQLTLEEFSPLNDTESACIDARDFLPSSQRDPEEMFLELRQVCSEEFRHQPWRRFIFSILNDEGIARVLKSIPAAKNVHHAWVGGLLEHTLGVFGLCRTFCDKYPELDRQTLLAGAILHDIGKIREFSGGFANDYTDAGRLLGHIMLGVEIITPFLDKSGLESGLREHLVHLVLSHHGETAFGAVKIPQTAEAFALHYADIIDARLAQCRGIIQNMRPDAQWSSWITTLDRNIWRAPKTPGTESGHKTRIEQCLPLLKA